jgi:hypothetical protein
MIFLKIEICEKNNLCREGKEEGEDSERNRSLGATVR